MGELRSQSNAYEVLGVLPTASLREIKEAFRKRSQLFHPDRGGRVDQIMVIVKAYNRLRLSDTREALGLICDLNSLPLRICPSLSRATSTLFENISLLHQQIEMKRQGGER
jgi:hypothetical protein